MVCAGALPSRLLLGTPTTNRPDKGNAIPSISDAGMDAAYARLRISSHRDRSLVTISLAGELDLSGVHRLAAAVLAAEKARARSIVVDLAEVTFIDSTGLNELLKAKKRYAKRFRVSPSSHPAVVRLLSQTGTTEMLTAG